MEAFADYHGRPSICKDGAPAMDLAIDDAALNDAEPGIPERHFYYYILAILAATALAIVVISVSGRPPKAAPLDAVDQGASDGGSDL